MKWINAEQKVTVTIYDEEHEEHHDKIMTVEEMLDTYTNEGCPTVYSNPERTGRWLTEHGDHVHAGLRPIYIYCSECGMVSTVMWNYCPNCGARMEE